jgi:gliding motility-associated-like protein
MMDIEMIQEGNTFTVLDLDFEEITCFGSNDGLIEILNVTGGQGDLEYSIDNGPFGSLTLFSTLGPGEHVITVRDELGCTISDRITLVEPVQIIVDAGEDRVINTGDSVVLNPSFNIDLTSIDQILWTANDSSILSSTAEILDFPATTTRYELTIIDTSGCVGSDFVDIIVERQVNIFIPNIFSPNGDGSNDVFKIEADETVMRVLDFQVFNRWGENVFTATDFAPADEIGWDGSFGTAIAPIGVYVYCCQSL